jgi:hypothetical protein
MNYLGSQNFENIWETYQKALGDGEDLAPLLFQLNCAVKQSAEAGVSASDIKGQMKVVEMKPGMTAEQIVAEQRIRKRIVADLKMMLEVYLAVQAKARRDIDSELDGMTSGVVSLGFQ